MALTAKSLFLYGFEVRADNQNFPFRAVAMGPQLNAVIPVGYYSLTSLCSAIRAALNAADTNNMYTVSANRAISGGTQNRITISTSGSYFDMLFQTGVLAATSIRDLIAFGTFDYTGALTYTNGASAGTVLTTEWWGNNYQPPELFVKNFGNVNVATNGEKEAIVWSIQRFIGVEFKYEPQPKALTEWKPFIDWMIQQKPFDFTPEVTLPSVVREVTLEQSSEDGKGLAFNMKEMLPQFPFMYTTGPMKFRIRGED